MNKTLDVVLTQCRKNQPLATLCNLPGPDAELTPAEMRALAGALTAAALLCEARVIDPRRLTQMPCSFSLVN